MTIFFFNIEFSILPLHRHRDLPLYFLLNVPNGVEDDILLFTRADLVHCFVLHKYYTTVNIREISPLSVCSRGRYTFCGPPACPRE